MERLNNEPSFAIEDSGFEVPKNYFNTVENNVLSKLNSEKESTVVSLFSRKRLYYISGIAASLLLLVAIFINNSNITKELSVEMVQDYFIESDLDTYELAELLDDANILEDDFKLTEETIFNEDNLEDYLIENADIEAILE